MPGIFLAKIFFSDANDFKFGNFRFPLLPAFSLVYL